MSNQLDTVLKSQFFSTLFDIVFHLPDDETTRRVKSEGLENYLPEWWNRNDNRIKPEELSFSIASNLTYSHLKPWVVWNYWITFERSEFTFDRIHEKIRKDELYPDRAHTLFMALNYMQVSQVPTISPVSGFGPAVYLVSTARVAKLVGPEEIRKVYREAVDWELENEVAEGKKEFYVRYRRITDPVLFDKIRSMTGELLQWEEAIKDNKKDGFLDLELPNQDRYLYPAALAEMRRLYLSPIRDKPSSFVESNTT